MLLNVRHIGSRLPGGWFTCLGSLPSSSLPTRELHSNNSRDGVAVDTTKQASATGMSLCQMNNHPDYRLRVAKQTFGGGNMKVKNQPMPSSNNKRSNFSSKSANYKNKVRENGLNIDVMENPVRSNDGTSSGAVINDRLRMARRKMIEKLNTPVEIQEAEITNDQRSNSSEEDKIAQENFWMDMWKDAGNEIKRLRGELKEESDEDAIADIQGDIKGLRKRKAEFAKLLRMDE
mmetsp:Transcript_10708/g.15296  ORF Transcript_10708/g.15296 Transcript_10708/m.15296 type:complete len:233 (+) Transcript_10708:97-795(+)